MLNNDNVILWKLSLQMWSPVYLSCRAGNNSANLESFEPRHVEKTDKGKFQFVEINEVRVRQESKEGSTAKSECHSSCEYSHLPG